MTGIWGSVLAQIVYLVNWDQLSNNLFLESKAADFFLQHRSQNGGSSELPWQPSPTRETSINISDRRSDRATQGRPRVPVVGGEYLFTCSREENSTMSKIDPEACD